MRLKPNTTITGITCGPGQSPCIPVAGPPDLVIPSVHTAALTEWPPSVGLHRLIPCPSPLHRPIHSTPSFKSAVIHQTNTAAHVMSDRFTVYCRLLLLHKVGRTYEACSISNKSTVRNKCRPCLDPCPHHLVTNKLAVSEPTSIPPFLKQACSVRPMSVPPFHKQACSFRVL